MNLVKLANGLANRGGYQITVVSLVSKNQLEDLFDKEAIKILFLNFDKKWGFIKGPFNYITELYKAKPDVIHSFLYHADFITGFFYFLYPRMKLFWNIRNSDIITGTSPITKFIARICAWMSFIVVDKIICVSISAANNHIRLGYNKKKMVVIPNGYHTGAKKMDNPGKKNLRSNLNIVDDDIVIGSVGRFNPYKDHETFIKAALLFLQKYPGNTKFLMIGDQIKMENELLSKLISNSPFSDKFILIGNQKNINDFYGIMDIFCLHSISEGFPNVLAEAMSFGIICVSTDVGAAKEILGNDDFIVSHSSPESISECFHRIVSMTAAKKVRISENNAKRIQNEYSFDSILNKYVSLYNSI